jgi:muconolactone delta-isomerase
MLFLVVSTPRPDFPSAVRDRQKAYWIWLNKLIEDGIVKNVWTKTGRGAVVVMDVDSHETLHKLINQWSENVPANFEVTALVSKEHQEKIAMTGTHPMSI